MKKWFKYIGEYKKNVILTPTFVLFEVILDVIIPIIMALMIDDGIDKGNMNVIIRYGILLVIACIVSLAMGFLSGRNGARASTGFAKNLRAGLFENVQDFSFHNIDKFSTTSLVTRMTTDVTNVQMAFQMIIRVCGRSPMMIIFSGVMAFLVSGKLALIFIGIIPILAVGLVFIIRKAFPLFRQVFKKYDKLNSVVQENIRGIRVVKSFVKEEEEIKKFEGVSEEIYTRFVKAEKILAFNSPLMQFSMYLLSLLLCYIGAQMIVGGSLSTGQFMSLFTYSMQILMSLMMLSMVFVMITISRASAERIIEVLDEKTSLKNKENPVTEVKDGSIVFEHVSFGYRGDEGKLSLSDINLNIESGQTVGIIGGTGSGKSTLTQLIPRLYDVTEGSIRVGGVDVRDYDIESLRDKVAMVLQKNVLFSGTIIENLRWGKKDATMDEMRHVCDIAQANEFISEFPEGYETMIEQGGSNVSGGQRQRLCIARALLKSPKILVLDDSTSAVDTKTDANIRKAFKEEMPSVTKLIIAQRVASIQEADQIIVMDNGQVAAVGKHEDLLHDSEIYREVYESQSKGGTDDAA